MNYPIEKHIFELLKHHNCVIISGLGGFILNNRSAYFNKLTHQIYPPSKLISFNKNLTQNDGLLANYLSSIEHISYEEACVEILKFSRKVTLKLKRGESILFENIGSLDYNYEQNIEFTPDTSFNFNAHSYGFKSFKLSALTPKIEKSNSYVVSVAAAILVLISLSIFSLNNNSIQYDNLFNLNPINTSQYTPRLLPYVNDSLGKEIPGIYNVRVSQIDFDLYKINGTNYHIATKKCFKLGFGRNVQIKIWKDEKNRIKREVCFLDVSETEYDDCYKINNVYTEMTCYKNKIVVMTKRGKMKEVTLVLEETYIDPYVIANTNPDQDLKTANLGNDSLTTTEKIEMEKMARDTTQSFNVPPPQNRYY